MYYCPMTNSTIDGLALVTADSIHYHEFEHALKAARIDHHLISLTPGPAGAVFAVHSDRDRLAAQRAQKLADELDTIMVSMICTRKRADSLKRAEGVTIRERAFLGLRYLTVTGRSAKVYSAVVRSRFDGDLAPR